MRFIASIFVPLLIVFAVFAGFIVSLVALDEVVTSRYATLADARAEELFARGWLPDILPSSARQIRTTNNLDLSISEGEFRFALGDYDQFSSRLRPYTEVEESGAWWAEQVARKERGGFETGAYADEESTWVFFCRPAEGFCEYAMWMRRVPNEIAPTG